MERRKRIAFVGRRIGLCLIVLALASIVLGSVSGLYARSTVYAEQAQAADDVAQAEASADGEAADYSAYTDQVLPDTFTLKTIRNYVPLELFNRSQLYIYNGREYGFVIHSRAGTNNVLLFKEIHVPHEDGNGYDVELRVVYQESFFWSANVLTYAYSPLKLSLTDIRMTDYIIDADMGNNLFAQDYDMSQDNGAYFVQSRYSGSFTYLEGNLGADLLKTAVSIASCCIGGSFGKAIGMFITAYDASKMIYDYSTADGAEKWQTRTEMDKAYDLPLTRQGQIDTNGFLCKNLTVDIDADRNEFLTYKSKNGDFARATFRVANENQNQYYIHNNIQFGVKLYNGAYTQEIGNGSITSIFANTGIDCADYGEMIRTEDGFELSRRQWFTPILKDNAEFRFAPSQAGRYRLGVASGYTATIPGETCDAHGVYTLDAKPYEVVVGKGGSSAAPARSRLLPSDFADAVPTFVNVGVERAQELYTDEASDLSSGVAYRMLAYTDVRHEIFRMDAMHRVDQIEMYIADDRLNIVAQANKIGSELWINYPCQPDRIYFLICENRSGDSFELCLNYDGREPDYPSDADDYPSGSGLYYRYKAEYTQYYDWTGENVYSQGAQILAPTQAGVYLEQDKTYYLHADERAPRIDFSDARKQYLDVVGQTVQCSDVYHEIVAFTPPQTAQYRFVGGNCRVFRDGAFVTGATDRLTLIKGEQCCLVKQELGGSLTVLPNVVATASVGDTVLPTAYNCGVLSFIPTQEMRYDVTLSDVGWPLVCDAYMHPIAYDHGYILRAGVQYYIVAAGARGESTVTVGKYVQYVPIDLYIDGVRYDPQTSERYNYGDMFRLPVPSKERYDFDGWRDADGNAVTDDRGNSFGELLADRLTLHASWRLRAIVMEIDFGNQTSKWWTGDAIVSDRPDGKYIEGDLIDQLINLRREFVKLPQGKRNGYFVSTFRYTKTDEQGDTDYYRFEPVWEVERYYIEFVPPYPGLHTMTRPLSYGSRVSEDVFPEQAYGISTAQYYLRGWQASGTGVLYTFSIQALLADMTPGYGSEFNYDYDGDGVADCTLVRLSAVVADVAYDLRINGKGYAVSAADGYTLGAIENYGYSASDYWGYNVRYTTNAYSRYFAVGDTVRVEDLAQHWQSGWREVTVDLLLDRAPIMVQLTYDDSDAALAAGNPATYTMGQGNIALRPIDAVYARFDYWLIDGVRADYLNPTTLGLNSYMSQLGNTVIVSRRVVSSVSRDYYEMKFGQAVNVETQLGYARIDAAKAGSKRGCTINIAPHVKAVSIYGSYTGLSEWKDTKIVIAARSEKLYIFMSDVSFMANNGASVIDAQNCPDLDLYLSDTVLTAGEVNVQDSYAAIVCNNLTLDGYSIKINGGSHVYAATRHATSGIYSGNANARLLILATGATIQGGNAMDFTGAAADGKEVGESGANGRNGANGGHGIDFAGTVVIAAGSTVTCRGGKGGNGKDGGNGATGRNGSFGVTTIDPGNGGNGGNGGRGGKAFASAWPVINGNLEESDGKSGAGGIGGKAGAPVKTIWNNERKGADGNNGVSGDELKES